jgi:hypothetical protein
VVFVISDFLDQGYDVALRRLARRHDVIAIQVGDEREVNIPDVGHILFVDPETGEESFVDTSSYAFQAWVKNHRMAHEQTTQSAFKGGQVELLKVTTQDDHADVVVRFFRARARRRGRR